MTKDSDNSGRTGFSVLRWLPILIIAVVMTIVMAAGWHRYVSFQSIGLNYEAMKIFIKDNLLIAVLVYVATYVVVVALSLPGGLVMTLAGGLLFGWLIGCVAAMIGATIGSTAIFLIARTACGDLMATRAGPWLGTFRAGFQEHALSYLLFLRLVPAFPFVVVNIAPALLGVKLSTYIVGTVVGILPGTAAFAIAGAGLGSVIKAQNKVFADCIAAKGSDACVYSIDTSALVTKELLIAFAALGVVALIPVVIKKWSKRHAAA